jgi:DNA modification methylase
MGNVSLRLHEGNCFNHLASLPDASIDLMVTDPPYGTTALAFDQQRIDWAAWWGEVHRVCKPTAVMVCFAAQPFATDLINSNRKHFRYDIVWEKTNAVGFLSANVRPLRGHELMLVFCRQFGARRSEAKSVYNPQLTAGAPYTRKPRPVPAHYHQRNTLDPGYENTGTRHPTSVLRVARDVPSLHPTAKPVELLRWLVRSYSHPGQTVLDPFMGSGSTGAACAIEGRNFVGIELDAQYFAVASKRLKVDGGAA